MPAGLASPGETPQEATVREAMEEAGVEVELTGILQVRYGLHPGRGQCSMGLCNPVVCFDHLNSSSL